MITRMQANDFYRPKNVRKHLRTFAKNASKNKKRTVILVLATVALLYLLVDNKGVLARVRLESQRTDMLAKIQAAEDSTARLKDHIKALEKDQKTIETIAREKYGMTRKGETMYRVQKEKQN